jgi:glutaminase
LYLLKDKADDLQKWVGDEPSGLPFNSPSFDD